jgi:hypothetical protein
MLLLIFHLQCFNLNRIQELMCVCIYKKKNKQLLTLIKRESLFYLLITMDSIYIKCLEIVKA